MYWVAVLFAAAVVSLWPVEARAASPMVALPTDWWQWVRVLLLAYVAPTPGHPYLLLPAWSLSIEVIYYCLIPLLARNRVTTLAWFAAGVIHASYAHWSSPDFYAFYFSPITATLPFSLGALIFHYKELTRSIPRVTLWGLVPLYVILSIFGRQVLGENPGSMYVALVVSSLILSILVHVTGAESLDSRAGSLSYPIYLLHFQFVPILIAVGFVPRSWLLIAIGAPTVIFLSWLLSLIEPGLERLKRPPPGKDIQSGNPVFAAESG
jgi:peptidoglycan/LPS O-acetylase OafA/YrhL